MKFMIILTAKKIGIASICAATALSGFAKDYSVVDNIDSKVALSGLEKVVTSEDNVRGIPSGGKIIKDGKILYDSGREISKDYATTGEVVVSFEDLITENTNQAYIYMKDNLLFSDVDGNSSIVSNRWCMGLWKEDLGWVGYANNNTSTSGREGFLFGSYYNLNPGEKPDSMILINDVNGDGIGTAVNGVLTPGPDDKMYSSDYILYGDDLTRGDTSDIPAYIPGSVSYYPDMTVAPWADGMPIAWALIYGITNNFENMSNTDSDGDGHTGFQEFEADTNPINSNSVFKVNYENGLVKFDSSTECSYSISSSPDLENWTNIFPNITGTGVEVGRPVPIDSLLRYFKAGVERVNR